MHNNNDRPGHVEWVEPLDQPDVTLQTCEDYVRLKIYGWDNTLSFYNVVVIDLYDDVVVSTSVSGSGTSHVTAFSFDEGTLATVLEKGIVIQGHGIRLNKVTITSPAGIILTEADNIDAEATVYTLGGQRVSQPLSGHLYIQKGRKFIAR